MSSDFQNILGIIGSVGNSVGIKGDGPTGLNAMQRASLTTEQQSALAQLNDAAAKPIDMSDPNLPSNASANPALGTRVQQYMQLQRQQAMQPGALSVINGMSGNSGTPTAGGTSTPTASPQGNGGGYDTLRDQMINAGRLKFALSGDPTELEKAYQSAFENDPMLAGRKKAAEQSNTLEKTPQGTYTTIPVGQRGGSNQPAQPQVGGETETNVMPNPIPGVTPTPNSPITTGDGKALFPNQNNLFKPDPNGNPTWKPANTETDVNQIKLNQTDLQKGNDAFSSAAQTLQQQKALTDNLINIYKGTQSGTLTMQHPEWINKLVGYGIIKDPKEIKNVADAQAAIQNHILNAIGTIKDQNANMEGSPTRTFGSEINAILEEGQNQTNQPEALFNTVAQARGLIDHHLDMINAWQKAGGSGNRLNNGTTMLPSQFVQKFNTNHDITDYTKNNLADMPKFKGMEGNNESSPTTKSWKRINGQLVSQ